MDVLSRWALGASQSDQSPHGRGKAASCPTTYRRRDRVINTLWEEVAASGPQEIGGEVIQPWFYSFLSQRISALPSKPLGVDTWAGRFLLPVRVPTLPGRRNPLAAASGVPLLVLSFWIPST